MKKIEIAALLCESKKIVEMLQRRGIVELCDYDGDELTKVDASSFISQFDKHRNTVIQALEIIDQSVPEKVSLLASFMGKREYEIHDFGKRSYELDRVILAANDVLNCRRTIDEYRNDITMLTVQRETLEQWRELDTPMNYTGTEKVKCYIGSLPRQADDEYFSSLLGESAHTDIIASYKDKTNIAVFCCNEVADSVIDTLKEVGFVSITEPSQVTACEQIDVCGKRIDQKNAAIEEMTGKICSYASMRKDFQFFSDYLQMRKDKYDAFKSMAMTESFFTLTGFVPEKYAKKLAEEIESKYTAAVTLYDPAEDEDVPVLLQNGKFSEPVEGITEMYALPNKHDVDPTAVMAFFYYLFFGMMLSDAGYGLLIVIATTLALKKFKLEPKMRKSLTMFQYCGISTVFWGALFGSWFGDIVQVVAREFFGIKIGSLALWFEPINNPMKLLLFSFLLGIAHLFLGLAVNLCKLWKETNPFDALCEVIPVYLTILGAVPLGGSILVTMPAWLLNISKYFLIVGAVLVVLTAGRSSKNIAMRFVGGLYGLYNIASGYLGDILSYSRLLALGLATGSIAGVINLIGTMPSNIVVKAIAFIAVAVIGHTANLAINMLGAYVHTDRLQFVELFSKFYEGGGREFKPLNIKTKYITLTEEKINE